MINFLLNEKKAYELKQQGQKKLIIAVFTGIGSVFSSLVGILLTHLLPSPTTFYWGTVLSSAILLPISILTALSVWDKLKTKWSKSDNFLLQKKYYEDELLVNLQILEKVGLEERDLLRQKKMLYLEYKKKLEQVELFQRENEKRLPF